MMLVVVEKRFVVKMIVVGRKRNKEFAMTLNMGKGNGIGVGG